MPSIASVLIHLVMVVSPEVSFEHPFVASQFEFAGHVGFDAAVAQQHRTRCQMPDVRWNVRRE
jgi:hypothetical protein